MGEAMYAYAFEADPRTGQYLLWSDTAASLTRLLIGLAISTVFALVVGILDRLAAHLGRDVRAVRRRAVDGAAAGAAAHPLHRHGARRSLEDRADRHRHAPKLIRDLALRVGDIPARADSSRPRRSAPRRGRSPRASCCRRSCRGSSIAVRLEIGPAWLFLIAAEAIAANSGLGYRIFLVRRYLSMDVILPYVVWITLLAFLMDLGLRLLQRRAFPWFAQARAA